MQDDKCYRAIIKLHIEFEPNPIFLDFFAKLNENLIDKVDTELKNTFNIPELVRNTSYDMISLKQVEMCWGCRNDQPNQEAHMDDPHGCLYEKTPEMIRKSESKKLKVNSSSSSSSYNLFDSN